MTGAASEQDEAKHDARGALVVMGLVAEGEDVTFTDLSGGVSCDVWLVTTAKGKLVVKRALPKLRVAAEWRAPVERAATEVAWIKLVAKLNPAWVPHVLGQDKARHLFVMDYLPAEKYPVWKAELAAGRGSAAFAGAVGAALARIHAATAGSGAVARTFAHDAQFHALRLEPYLLFTAAKHPEFAGKITALADSVARARIALMQGDVSPKNILVGPDGPVFIDAETACYGDPAFDLAFCLNHLLLKQIWHPEHRDLYVASFTALRDAYLKGVDWEEPEEMEARTAALLPALLLARVDGKSPAEYLTKEEDQSFVREKARALLKRDGFFLQDILDYFAGSR
jgi:aminoglycoside phosphotransferase (APT) family kinase protein